jgi:hypothetical protein
MAIAPSVSACGLEIDALRDANRQIDRDVDDLRMIRHAGAGAGHSIASPQTLDLASDFEYGSGGRVT